MKSRLALLFLLCVLALGACGDGNPVSSRQPAANSGTMAKRISSSVTFSTPVAGLTESRMSGADTVSTDWTDVIAVNPDTVGTDSTDVITANPGTSGKGMDPGQSGTLVFTGTADATEEWGADAFELTAAAITGDTLAVTVSYSGGCQDHQFTLVASASFLESDPVQLEVALVHNANGDVCEALLTEDYLFSLVPIKERFQSQYQDSGRIVLQLEDAPDELLYEFAE